MTTTRTSESGEAAAPRPVADSSDQSLAGPYRGAWDVLAAEALPPRARILDLGCGPGFLLRHLDARAYHCVGLEMRADVALEARESAPGTEVALGDGTRLPFADRTFDAVVALEVLEHVNDDALLLAEIRRVMRPGGLLMLTTPHAGRWSFLDPDNYKFRAPWLHRIGYTLIGRREEYRRRFQGATFGSFARDGDPWHRHYSVDQVRALASGFEIESARIFGGLIFTLGVVAAYTSMKLFNRWIWPVQQIIAYGNGENPHGYQLVALLRRTDEE